MILRAMSLSKPGAWLSDLEVIDFAAAVQQYLDSIAGNQISSTDNAKVLKNSDFPKYHRRYVYKFTDEESYEKYVRRGSFQLSSLSRFRGLEALGSQAGDRFEGETFCVLRSGDRELTVRALSGFDTLVFSASAGTQAISHMSKRFGSVALRIELKPFARRLLDLTGGQILDVRKVAYGDLKIARGRLGSEIRAGFPPDLTAELGQKLRETARLPSIFAKPDRFKVEDEVRIAIRFQTDLVQDTFVIDDPSLLQFVTRVD